MAGLEGVVNDCGDEGTYGIHVGFYKGCGERVKGASRGFALVDEILNLLLGDVCQEAERLGDR